MAPKPDLSFLDEPAERPAPSGVDLAFLDMPTDIPTATDVARNTVKRRGKPPEEGGFEQGYREGSWNPMDWPGMAKRAFVGGDRETRATRELPSLADVGIDRFLGDRAPMLEKYGISAALLTTLDPVEMVQVLSEATNGDLVARPDEAGNLLLSLDGREVVLNKPGMSAMDWMQLLGAAALFAPSARAAKTGGAILPNAARVGTATAATQAGIEGLQAGTGGEFNLVDTAIAGAMGGGVQGIFQALAQKVLPWIREKGANYSKEAIPDDIRVAFRDAYRAAGFSDDLTDDEIRAAISGMDDAPRSPTEMAGVAGEVEFGVPLTKGQRTLDQPSLVVEDRARAGVHGEGSQRAMLNFERETQKPAINAAKESLEDAVGQIDATPGGVIREGVKAAERTADAAVDEAYGRVGKVSLGLEGMRGLMGRMRGSMRSIEFDPYLPETQKMLALVDQFSDDLAKLGDQGVNPQMSLKRIEQLRRRLNRSIDASQTNADAGQIRVMKQAFDDYIDEAIEASLFSGDDQAITALKEARGEFQRYANKFRINKKKGKSGKTHRDEGGEAIATIVEADPTDEQIVNFVFGASGINKQTGAAVAKRFKEVLGADSPGWTAVRREGLRRFLVTGNDGFVSPKKSLTAFKNAMEKSPTLMREIYTTEELATFRRFLVHINRTDPSIITQRANRSGTGAEVIKMMQKAMPWLNLGDPTSGVLINATAGGGLEAIATRGARNAVRPFSAYRAQVKPSVVTGGTVAGRNSQGQEP